MMANVKIFADTLHSEYPNAKLIIMGEHFPSMKLMMPAYRASGTLSNIYNDLRLVAQLNEAYQEFANQDGYSDFVRFVNVSSELDSDYNFPVTQKDVNTRNTTYKEPYANNGVHPGNEGYLQIADAAYRSIVAEFCQ